jgi:hypothetical protein
VENCDCVKLRPGALWRRRSDRQLVTVISRVNEDEVRISGPCGLCNIAKLTLAETADYVGRARGCQK